MRPSSPSYPPTCDSFHLEAVPPVLYRELTDRLVFSYRCPVLGPPYSRYPPQVSTRCSSASLPRRPRPSAPLPTLPDRARNLSSSRAGPRARSSRRGGRPSSDGIRSSSLTGSRRRTFPSCLQLPSTGSSVHSQARLFPLALPSAVTDNTCTDPHALLSALAGTRRWTVRQRTRSRTEVEPSRSSRHTWRLSLSRASHIRDS